MIPKNCKTIIFDLGGVILNLDYNLTKQAFIKLGVENFDEMYTQTNQTDLFNKYETGQISSQHFINKLLPHLPQGTSPNKVVHAWNKMILDFPLSRLNFLDQLKEKYTLLLLSNTNEIHLEEVRRSLKKTTERTLESYFEKTYYSHLINKRKPSGEIFEYVCNEHNLNIEKTVFIDDTLGHVEGAKSIGLKGIHLANGMTIEGLFQELI